MVNVAGVKFGGQCGQLPSVLCGTIFYQGHKIVADEERGVFDRATAEKLISRQAELSEETGCPSVLHLFARSIEAFERYLDFADGVWSGPFIIDSADASTRSAAALLVSELGYADRAIYNSISLATEEKEMQALLESEIDSSIILAYNPSQPGVEGSMAILETGGNVREKGLLAAAQENGIHNLLIDPAVLPLGSGAGSALRFCVAAKARLGLPVGSGIHNAVSSWPWLSKKETTIKKGCDAAAGAMQLLAGADFLLYGPIESADIIFPAAALADILIAEAVRDLDIAPGEGHPLYRLV
ncbi:MAG: tetrahydromethanopterin S-methyltransferase subunit H [Methanothrix sp.]|nr:tetrahydromethanopterin S-methyltransferase subunit H [Methanothrix sp.]